MGEKKKLLYVLCDLEGASQISPANAQAINHGSELWQKDGRRFITSDVKAICEAANEFGIHEIVLNDSHDNGNRTPNVLMKELPNNVRIVRRPYLPGKPRHMVRGEPFGMIIVGQHAMAGGGGFKPHTISGHIGEVTVNGIRVGEIGLELAAFMGTPLLAVVGEQAAIVEAKALCPSTVGIPVKSLEKDWFPPATETRSAIHDGILEALQKRDDATGLRLESPFRFTFKPAAGFVLNKDRRFFLHRTVKHRFFGRSKGQMRANAASWETKTIIGGLYAIGCCRLFTAKRSGHSL
jgi:D-aminopeptidase